jgi:hypothetical protein
MTTLRLAVVLCAIVALVLPGAASAALPKTNNTLIVPGKSIGGVALGMSGGKVKKAWGTTENCPYQCVYKATTPKLDNPAYGSVLLLKPDGTNPTPVASDATVWTVALNAGYKRVGTKLVPDFKTPLTRFKTAKGIGIGSTTSQLKGAYHGLKKLGAGTVYSLSGKGTIATEFTLVAGRITSIAVRLHPRG